MERPFPNLEAPVAPAAAPRNLAARVRADRDLPAAGAHAEARGGFPRRAEAVGVAIGQRGGRLVVAVLVGMVAVVRVAADHHPAVRVVVPVAVVVVTSSSSSSSAGGAVPVQGVNSALGVPPGALGPTDGGRHGNWIAALLAMVVVVGGAGRCRRSWTGNVRISHTESHHLQHLVK